MTTEVKVRCNGALHRVVLSDRGRLGFPDHPDLDRERVLTDFGGRPCRCLAVLQAWRQADKDKLPKGLLDAYYKRPNRKPYEPYAHPEPKSLERLGLVVTSLIEKAFWVCKYRRHPATELTVVASDRGSWGWAATVVHHKMKRYGNHNYRTVDRVCCVVRVDAYHWWAKVFRRGLTVLDDHLVLSVDDEYTDDLVRIDWLSQGRGYNLGRSMRVMKRKVFQERLEGAAVVNQVLQTATA